MLDTEQSFNRMTDLRIEEGLFSGKRSRVISVPAIVDYIGEGQLDSDPRSILWDQWAGRYHTLLNLGITERLWKGFGEVVAANVPPNSGQRRNWLDAGCGTGYVIEMLATGYPQDRIVGADLSIPFLRKTQERIGTKLQEALGRIALHRMDLTKPYPWEDGSFDGVTMNFVFQYFGPSEQQHIISENARVLRSGGQSFISTFTAGTAFGDVIKPIIIPELRQRGIRALQTLANIPVTRQFDKFRQEGTMRNPSIEDLERMHRQAGFSEFKVARQMQHPQGWDYGVYTVATK